MEVGHMKRLRMHRGEERLPATPRDLTNQSQRGIWHRVAVEDRSLSGVFR